MTTERWMKGRIYIEYVGYYVLTDCTAIDASFIKEEEEEEEIGISYGFAIVALGLIIAVVFLSQVQNRRRSILNL